APNAQNWKTVPTGMAAVHGLRQIRPEPESFRCMGLPALDNMKESRAFRCEPPIIRCRTERMPSDFHRTPAGCRLSPVLSHQRRPLPGGHQRKGTDMAFRTAASTLLCRTLVIASCLALLGVAHAQAGKKGYIKKLTVDPNAPKIGLFEGMDEGAIDVKMIAKNAEGGNLLVENKTKDPLTVELP